MPNWCENSITFSSTRKCDLERLKNKVCEKDCVFSFNKIAPYPKYFNNISKLSEMRIKRQNKEAIKRGYKSFDDMPDSEEKNEIEKRFPYITDGFNNGGYEWCCENWGTKWNVRDIIFDSEIKKEVNKYVWRVSFDTAWSPPIPIFHKIAEKFPNISFSASYMEESIGFEGEFMVDKGKVISHSHI